MRFVSFIVSSCFKSCVTTHGSLLKELLQVCVCKFLQAVHNKAAIASRFIVSVVSINSFNGLKVSEKVFYSYQRVRLYIVIGLQKVTKSPATCPTIHYWSFI